LISIGILSHAEATQVLPTAGGPQSRANKNVMWAKRTAKWSGTWCA